MKTTQQLHDLGQSLRLDNITRGLLTKGTLHHYITALSVTGPTSNPTIVDHWNERPQGLRCPVHQGIGSSRH
jgi:transaldolase